MSNKRGQMGFTLIEIISVLVILGILAAVAVPKYYDLQKEAADKAAAAVAAEAIARFNLKFGQELLKNTECSTAITKAQAEAFPTTGTSYGEDWEVTFTPATGGDSPTAASVKATNNVTKGTFTATSFDLPTCETRS